MTGGIGNAQEDERGIVRGLAGGADEMIKNVVKTSVSPLPPALLHWDEGVTPGQGIHIALPDSCCTVSTRPVWIYSRLWNMLENQQALFFFIIKHEALLCNSEQSVQPMNEKCDKHFNWSLNQCLSREETVYKRWKTHLYFLPLSRNEANISRRAGHGASIPLQKSNPLVYSNQHLCQRLLCV